MNEPVASGSNGQSDFTTSVFGSQPTTLAQRGDAIQRSGRHKNINLRTQLLRIIEKAGLTPWPKLFQNLRASRATELAKEHPGHVAAEWLGHSTKVAANHYWQTTYEDFARALQKMRAQYSRSRTPRRATAECPVANSARLRFTALLYICISGRGGSRTRTGVAPQRILSP
jgi:hypothetical protein